MVTERETGQTPPAKSYEGPELKEFGTIAELTATVGNMAVADAGIPPQQKSQT